MPKFLRYVVLLCLLVAMAACGDNGDDDASNPEPVPTAERRTFDPFTPPSLADNAITLDNVRDLAVRHTFTTHTDAVNGVFFSDDSAFVATTSNDDTVRIWDTTTGEQVSVLIGHANDVVYADFSPDGTRIITGSNDFSARVWNVFSGSEQFLLANHTDFVWQVAYSPIASTVVSAAGDDTARVWNPENGEEIAVLDAHTDNVNQVVYSPDGSQIITVSSDATVRAWGGYSGQPLHQFTGIGHSDTIYAVRFSPDGNTIATSAEDDTIVLWYASDGREYARIDGRFGDFDSPFSPDGSQLIVITNDNGFTTRIWDMGAGLLDMVIPGLGVGFSPDGRMVILITTNPSGEFVTRFWDIEADTVAHELRGVNAAFGISPDGTLLVAVADNVVTLWSVGG